jgi:hypothetical protein
VDEVQQVTGLLSRKLGKLFSWFGEKIQRMAAISAESEDNNRTTQTETQNGDTSTAQPNICYEMQRNGRFGFY